ncbi:Uncharacterized protein PECH_001014 [Penicillium ucsense]|uniref:Uncharacterized protein n=1 Tax=Penicillium ucsense TaxID=2839758 RepID=A0A8J8WE74_9EURO|nr:Uncharacterized protein PECM_003669 [Penicillium ucsense]KAF7733183.1 Uncharacterized protein PECH_001014 [Penicillium ucsense]
MMAIRSIFQRHLGLLLLLLLPGGWAQMCSFWETACIDPLAQTAVPLDFSPLFPDPVTFYYGFDELSTGKGRGPMTKAGFWLRYRNEGINMAVVTSNRTSEVALRIGNLTGTPSGNTNGCDGVWGRSCSGDVKSALRHAIFNLISSGEVYSKPLEAALNHMMHDHPRMPNCGAPIFDVASIPVSTFVKERYPASQPPQVKSAGSWWHPWRVWYIDGMTSDQQASQVAVGIVARSPAYGSPPPASPDDIQIELVCLQAPQGSPVTFSKEP